MNTKDIKIETEKLLRNLPDKPEFKGRGIVTSAGGNDYFANGYVALQTVRDKGCTLPMQWFCLEGELTDKQIAVLENVDIDVQILQPKQDRKYYKRDLGGWQAKVRAIKKSKFKEVLWIDADNFVLRDPTYLFDTPEYKEYGALFWKDVWVWEEDKREILWDIFGVDFQHTQQFESGQLLIDKDRCWPAVCLVDLYNWGLSEYVYKILYGDKDTFYFAFRRAKVKYNMVKEHPAGRGWGLIQHDPEGRQLFRHCTGAKFSLSGRSRIRHNEFSDYQKMAQHILSIKNKL